MVTTMRRGDDRPYGHLSREQHERRGYRRGYRDEGDGRGRAEHRRLARIDKRAVWGETGGGVYRNTPSPVRDGPSASSDSGLTDEDEEAVVEGLEHELEKVQRQHARLGGGDTAKQQAAARVFEEDEVLQELEKQEVELFKSYLKQIQDDLEKDMERQRLEEEEDAIVGPEPLYRYEAGGHGLQQFESTNMYGQNLRPGEGTAMAAYVQQGQRIPRRGEVGLDAAEIDQFERAGYVMSGNRNAKMNAIRMRKENQVYSAEEKAALAMLNFEEQKKKEAKIIDDMKKLVEKTVNDVSK